MLGGDYHKDRVPDVRHPIDVIPYRMLHYPYNCSNLRPDSIMKPNGVVDHILNIRHLAGIFFNVVCHTRYLLINPGRHPFVRLNHCLRDDYPAFLAIA